MLPLTRLILTVALALFGVLIAAFCLQVPGETFIDRNRRFLIVLAGTGSGAFALRLLLLFIGRYIGSAALDGIAVVCFWVSIAAMFGYLMVYSAASQEDRAEALRHFFRPLYIVKNQIGQITVQGGHAAIGNQGSHIVQSGNISVEVQQQLHSFIDQLKELPLGELPEDRKQEAIEHLHTLNYQCMLPPARRDLPKIVTALQRLPAICSGVATCFQAWEKIEAVVKPHLGL